MTKEEHRQMFTQIMAQLERQDRFKNHKAELITSIYGGTHLTISRFTPRRHVRVYVHNKRLVAEYREGFTTFTQRLTRYPLTQDGATQQLTDLIKWINR